MDSKKVTITYTDEFDLWQYVAEGFPTHLPLRNLQWKSANRPLRTIHTLGVELKRLTPDTGEKQHQLPASLLEKPYLNLYFVSCDDNETYRQTVKKQIRDWLTIVSSKKNQEWLIEQFSTKLKQILIQTNATGTCVYLRLSDNDSEDLEAWQDTISKIKEGILSSFDQHVMQYEDDIRRFDAQRTKPGWNYCTFFIWKEGLAQSFEIMNLHEDALLQYDELEASFFQVLKGVAVKFGTGKECEYNEVGTISNRALAWFGHFGGKEPKDDSAKILDVKKKPYRDLIMQNEISVFDFRNYLFARQCQLLGRLHRPIEICRRAQIFISSFARSINDSKESIGKYFLESWIYSSCMSVVDECEELAPSNDFEEEALIAFNTSKGELLDLARKQLDKLGIYYGHLPSDIPFITALSHFPSSQLNNHDEETTKAPVITNADLVTALQSAESFDILYLRITNRALRAYEASTRTRSLLRLQGDVAALQFHRQIYSDAATLMEKLPWCYGEHGWSVIENSLLTKYAACLKELGHIKKYPFPVWHNHALLTKEQAIFYGEELKELSVTLETEVARPLRPMFAVLATSIVDHITNDEPYLKVQLKNNLLTTFTFDQLAVRLVSGENDEIWFVIRDEALKPGINTYHLYSDTTACGSYVVENCRMNIGKIIFTHNFLNEGRKRAFRINDHPAILRAQVVAPTEIHIGEQQYFIARVFTGLKSVEEGTLILKPISEGLSFPSQSTYHAVIKSVVDDTISDEIISEEELELTEFGIRIPANEPNRIILLKIPYDCNWGSIEHKVKISVEYASDGKSRVFSSIDTVKVWLPFSVTEFHIFRDDCLYLKMDITSNGSLPVRILSTTLLPSKMYNVVDNAAQTESTMILFPKQHASFVYKLSRKEHNLLQHLTFVTDNVNEQLLQNADYHWYGMSDELDLGEFESTQCERIFNSHGDSKKSLVNVVAGFWKEYNRIHKDDVTKLATELKSEISFPIDVPLSKVLNTVELIITKSNQLVVGEPCHCHLIIQQSSYWNYPPPGEDKDKPLEFFYDVHVDFDNWLLSGHKKFCFKSKVGEIQKFFITLVPLKTGHLLVPTIRISSLSSKIFSETVYINNAQQVLVRPRAQSATFFIEQQHRIHPVNAGVFGGPGHHHLPSDGYDDVEY
ncbi:5577_t:CDS:10 [Ambispora gerdemannii]|uniref:5577_t:CDS:1 n=1 Tax=Ambispora gerdemannii TaxID=144530 RepID=A0A9N8YQ04_9GLOM|nr:5577_t:CDS:10 [Ambispora gerdemannii]